MSSDQGERGKTGDRGVSGDQGVAGGQGDTGDQGERGQSGDRGVTGERGEKGDHGQKGERGAPYSSWLTRRVVLAYSIVVVGMFVAFIGVAVALSRIEELSRQQCRAGNERSDLQVKVFQEGKARTEAFDFRSIINLPEPERSEVAQKLKTESLVAADHNIARVPYLDCSTGKRVTPTTTTPGGNP